MIFKIGSKIIDSGDAPILDKDGYPVPATMFMCAEAIYQLLLTQMGEIAGKDPAVPLVAAGDVLAAAIAYLLVVGVTDATEEFIKDQLAELPEHVGWYVTEFRRHFDDIEPEKVVH